eukprot:8750790-Alexandrium_andersonii.AAC.1
MPDGRFLEQRSGQGTGSGCAHWLYVPSAPPTPIPLQSAQLPAQGVHQRPQHAGRRCTRSSSGNR